MIKRPIFVIAGSFVLGEVLALLNVAVSVWIPAAVCAVFVCGALSAGIWRSRNVDSFLLFLQKGFKRLCLLLCLAAAFGAGYGRGRAEMLRFRREAEAVRSFGNVRPLIMGRVVKIQEKENGTSLILEDVTARAGRTEGKFRQISIFAEETGYLEIGWHISLRGELRETERAGNPGEFDFGLYSRSAGYCCQVFGEGIQAVRTETIPYLEAIRRFKNWCGEILERVCRQEDLGVFQAVVLGDQSRMEPEMKEMYQRHGISHILAVSGQHLTVVGGGIYLILRRMGLRQTGAGIAGGILVVAYGILTGSSGSAMRAVVMILCLWLAAIAGRSYDSLSAMGLAAVILLWQKPYLLFQSGFQLSFAAVWAIAGLGPCLGEWLGAQSGRQKTWLISLSVQMVLTPIVVWHYFRHPVYGIFLNLLVLPFAAGLIYSALGAIALGAFSAGLGKMAAGTGHWILVIYEEICGIFEKFPGYSLLLGRPGIRRIAAYGIFLAVLVSIPMWAEAGKKRIWGAGRGIPKRNGGKKEKKFRWKWLLWCLGAYFACIFLLKPEPVRGLCITCLDVGQGDGIAAEWKEGVILVDGGSSSRSGLGEECLEPFLESRGIDEIRCALVSHGDSDHISGLTYLLGPESSVKIRNLVLPRSGKGQEVYEELEHLASDRGTQVIYVGTGDRISLGEVELFCLYGGDEAGGRLDRNKQSPAMDLSFGGIHMLLTGDMDQDCERQLMETVSKEELSRIQLLKVAHHGSDTSSCAEFLEAVSPQAAFISYGKGNSYGHPSPQVLERLKETGAQIWETGRSGAIRIEIDEGKVRIKGYRQEE